MFLYVVPCLCRWTWGYYMLTPQTESAKKKKRTKTAREKWALTINGERLSDSFDDSGASVRLCVSFRGSVCFAERDVDNFVDVSSVLDRFTHGKSDTWKGSNKRPLTINCNFFALVGPVLTDVGVATFFE